MRSLALGLLAAAATFFLVAAATRDEEEPAPARQTGGAEVFARLGCGGCHTLAAAGSQGQTGPVLDEVLANHSAASLEAKILDPGPSSFMPSDFGERLRPGELEALVAFLLEEGRQR